MNDEVNRYAQMGRAALLPGMQYMLDLMQRQLDEMREMLAVAQKPAKKMGRPPKVAAGEKLRSGWPADPEERKREMKSRMKKRKKNAPTVRESLSESRKKQWAAMSPAKKKKRLAAMLAGRKPTVLLEQAS